MTTTRPKAGTPERQAKALLKKRTAVHREVERLSHELRALARELPPVHLSELSGGAAGIKDRTFAAFVSEWMDRHMSGLDSTLLDCGNYEKWEVVPLSRFGVRAYDEENFAVWDTESDGWCDPDLDPNYHGESHRQAYGGKTATIEDREVVVFADEDHAETAAAEMNRAAAMPSYGFPFAWNWCYEPDSFITNEELQEAGFLVYHYDAPNDGRRIAGIDAGGFDFYGTFYAHLVVIVCERMGETVETEKGPRVVTMKKE